MPTRPLTPKQLRTAITAWLDAGRVVHVAAKALHLPPTTFTNRLVRAVEKLGPEYGIALEEVPAQSKAIDRKRAQASRHYVRSGEEPKVQPYTFTPIPEDDVPIEELVAHRKKQYAAKAKHEEARRLIPVKINIDGPIGILHFGDPHVDDDGTDILALEKHTDLVAKTEGLFAANCGDTTNSWVGRLAHLYSQQSTSSKQAWKLAEWFIGRCNWLYMIGGNHDCLSLDTEALTARGWKRYEDIQDDDFVLSRTPEGHAVWTPILSKFSRENTDAMVSIESRTISFLGTAGHRVLLSKRNWDKTYGDYEYRRAEDLPARFRLPVAGNSPMPGVAIDKSAIELAGWLLTDGSISRTGNHVRVSFWQSKDVGKKRLRALLAAVGTQALEVTRTREIEAICGRRLLAPSLPQAEFRLNAVESRRLLGLLEMETKGSVPPWLFEASDEQFDVFLEGVVGGDGVWENADKTCAVVHGVRGFLDSLQAAAVAHGWRAFISQAKGRNDYRLNLAKTTTWEAQRAVVARGAPPEPRVWCVNVPLTNFMVRRNGKAYFTGNCWNGDADPLKWITRQKGALYQSSEVRLDLKFPNGTSCRVNARHDFAGHSQYNPAHGAMKAVNFGVRDHIAVAGHRHKSGYGVLKDPDSGITCHAVQVASYKIYDRYARDRGFRDQHLSPCAVTLINPYLPDTHPDKVHVYWDPEEAVSVLKFQRKRRRAA